MSLRPTRRGGFAIQPLANPQPTHHSETPSRRVALRLETPPKSPRAAEKRGCKRPAAAGYQGWRWGGRGQRRCSRTLLLGAVAC